MFTDRRGVSRYVLSLPVYIGDICARTQNIGIGGALIISPRRFEAGDVVDLVVTITFTEHAAPTPLACTARVRRVHKLHRQWVIAVEFDELRVLNNASTTERAHAAATASL